MKVGKDEEKKKKKIIHSDVEMASDSSQKSWCIL